MSKNKIIIGIVVVLILIICASILAVSLSGGDLSKQLKLGEKYLAEGKYEEAILAFEKAIKIDEKNIDARVGLAKAYVATDKLEKAEEVLKDAIGIDPARPEPYIELANVYILEGKNDEAIRILEQGYENTKDESIKKLLDNLKPQPPKASLESGTYEGVQTVDLASIPTMTTESNEPSITSNDSTLENRIVVASGKSIEITNNSDSHIYLEISGSPEYISYKSDGKVLEFGVKWPEYNSVLVLDKGERAVLTNTEKDYLELLGDMTVLNLKFVEGSALKHVIVQPNESIEFTNSSEEILRFEESRGKDFHCQVYGTDGNFNPHPYINNNQNITTGQKAIVTNYGSEPIEIVSPIELFNPQISEKSVPKD
ncbi:tetratricopeptide repeat protein [Lutispora sp.]|uniref:tetratricopeptide repeat protein n=1 Tax=Lutispora sp. TaxID=2828727 RepID=UPI00356435EC